MALKTSSSPARIFIGTDIGVFTSDDGGGNWDGVPRIDLPDDLIGLPIRALGIDPTASCPGGAVKLYAGSGGRGMFSRCPNVPVGELPWTLSNSGLTALRAQAAAVGTRGGVPAVFAGLASGGVITSVDNGSSWQGTPEDSRSVRGIAVDPTNASIVYAATGEGVIKSQDGGDAWALASTGLPTDATQDPTNPPRTVRSIIVDPATPTTLYAAVGGVYKSVDGGATWAAVNGSLPTSVTCGPASAPSCPGDGSVSAFAVDRGPGTDATWGTLYAATDGAGVFKSIDGGATWSAMSTGLGSDLSVLSLVLDPLEQSGVALYAGTSTGKVFKSVNGGGWISFGSGLSGEAVTALVVRLGAPSRLYAGLNGGGVYAIAANSNVWNSMNTGLSSLNVAGLGFDPTGAGTLYAATLGRGVFDFESAAGNPPFISITDPLPPTFTASTNPALLTGTAGPGLVFWFTNRGHAGFAAGTNPWTASVPLHAGPNLITVTVVDSNFNQSSAQITGSLPVETTPPTVTITTPTSTQTFATMTTPLTIGGTASDNTGVTQVTWTNSRGGSGTASGTTSWTASVPLQPGSNVITVAARDAVGNVGTDVLTVALTTFADVPADDIFFTFIEALSDAGITAGCSTSPPLYCPDSGVTRDQMAVFLLRGIHGAGYQPPAATGTMFTDVPLTQPFATWIEQLAREGITGGCSTSPPQYCPDAGGDAGPDGGVSPAGQARGGVPAARPRRGRCSRTCR